MHLHVCGMFVYSVHVLCVHVHMYGMHTVRLAMLAKHAALILCMHKHTRLKPMLARLPIIAPIRLPHRFARLPSGLVATPMATLGSWHRSCPPASSATMG